MYTPKPYDTKNIELPAEIHDLVEKLAENVHENWASNRMAQGWTYGEKRDDINKTTPVLVPYSDLPESEKMYDRCTAVETLKFIVANGYKIEKTD